MTAFLAHIFMPHWSSRLDTGIILGCQTEQQTAPPALLLYYLSSSPHHPVALMSPRGDRHCRLWDVCIIHQACQAITTNQTCLWP